MKVLWLAFIGTDGLLGACVIELTPDDYAAVGALPKCDCATKDQQVCDDCQDVGSARMIKAANWRAASLGIHGGGDVHAIELPAESPIPRNELFGVADATKWISVIFPEQEVRI